MMQRFCENFVFPIYFLDYVFSIELKLYFSKKVWEPLLQYCLGLDWSHLLWVLFLYSFISHKVPCLYYWILFSKSVMCFKKGTLIWDLDKWLQPYLEIFTCTNIQGTFKSHLLHIVKLQIKVGCCLLFKVVSCYNLIEIVMV